MIFDEVLARLGGSRERLPGEKLDLLIDGLAAEIDDDKQRARFKDGVEGELSGS